LSDVSDFKQISDQGLRTLADLMTNLTKLDVMHNEEVSDVGLRTLAGLTNLTSLGITCSRPVLDTGLRALARLDALTHRLQLVRLPGNLRKRGYIHTIGWTHCPHQPADVFLLANIRRWGLRIGRLDPPLYPQVVVLLAVIGRRVDLIDLGCTGKVTDDGLLALTHLTGLTNL
jgi:hypothetical protein